MYLIRDLNQITFEMEMQIGSVVRIAGAEGAEVDCFTLGVQFQFQKSKVLELGNGDALSMDATFGTTRLQVSHIQCTCQLCKCCAIQNERGSTTPLLKPLPPGQAEHLS